MSDGLLPLNPATIPGGQVEDVEDLTGAGGAAVIRQRLQVTGAVLAEVARVQNTDPDGHEYALVTRDIPQRITADPTLTQVPAGTSAVTLAAANPFRKRITLQTQFISGGSNLYVRLGAGVTTTLYHVLLVPGAYYELPDPVYVGDIEGVWDGVVGFVNVGELE